MSERRERDKLSHAAVAYENPSRHARQTCAQCVHFITAKPPRCEGVKSPIQPGAWCKRFERKNNRRNPNKTAEELYQQFHGRAPDRVSQYFDVDYNSHPKLSQLGLLVSLWVGERCEMLTEESRGVVGAENLDPENPGWCVHLEFDQPFPHLAAEPDGRQLYFVGGNQDIDRYLQKFHVDTTKDLIDLGPALVVEYRSEKRFDNFRTIDYFHGLGEKSGKFLGDNGLNPRLVYNRIRRKLALYGGVYRVKPEGIVD